MFGHTDITGRLMQVNDIVVFTAAGAGRNLPPLKFGRVLDFTKAGVRVKYLNKDFTPEQREERILVPTGEYYKRYDGTMAEKTKYEPTGRMIDLDPENIRYYKDRFMILDIP